MKRLAQEGEPMIIDTSGRGSLNPSGLGFRFETALVYASRLHATQRRKGSNTPYLGHLLGVASQVIEAGGDEDQAIAALLHDAIEDQGGDLTGEAIRSLFGDRVVGIVQGCSDEDPNSEERTAENWPIRKERYLAHLREADRDVVLVSLADKIYNARAIVLDLYQIGAAVWTRFHVGREDQLWYYRGLADAFREATRGDGLSVLADEFGRIVAEMERISRDD
jgi:GTP pyrophosphokinase